MMNSETAKEVVNDMKSEYELIRAIGSIFLMQETDIGELTESLSKIEDLPENCLFSDDLLDAMRINKQYWIRRICAMNGRPADLDVLVSDPNDLVRFEVLFHKRPQDLKILKEDDNPDIRGAAIGYFNSDYVHNGILGKY